MKFAPHQRQGIAQRSGTGERSKVFRPIFSLDAGEREARNRVVKINLQQEKPFVVAEADVVTRMKLLDEFALEQDRLRFILYNMDVQILDGIDERPEFHVPSHPA